LSTRIEKRCFTKAKHLLFDYLSAEHIVDSGQRGAHQQIAAFMAGMTAGNVRAVVATLLRLFGGQIAECAAGQLEQEGLLCIASCTDLVAVIEEQLEGIGSECHVAEAHGVQLHGEGVCELLLSKRTTVPP